MFSAGDCLHIETNKDAEGKVQGHMHVIVIDVVEPAGITIVVPVESYRSAKQDSTTILEIGEHSFIVRDTYVNYRRAKIQAVVDLQKLIKEGTAKKMDAMPDNVLQRIRRGITRTDRIPPAVVALYEDEIFKGLA